MEQEHAPSPFMYLTYKKYCYHHGVRSLASPPWNPIAQVKIPHVAMEGHDDQIRPGGILSGR